MEKKYKVNRKFEPAKTGHQYLKNLFVIIPMRKEKIVRIGYNGDYGLNEYINLYEIIINTQTNQ